MWNFKISRLEKDIQVYSNIILYGAGKMAHELYAALQGRGIDIKYCVVSDAKNKNDTFEGYAIYSVQEKSKDIQKNGSIVLIAVSEIYLSEIKETLARHNIANYIVVTDYIREKSPYMSYNDKTFEAYLQEIAEWYIDAHNGNYDDLETILLKFSKNICKYSDSQKEIIFFVLNMSPRVIKIAKALKKQGYHIYAIYMSTVEDYGIYQNQLWNVCEKYHKCVCIEEAMYWMLNYNARCIHIFSSVMRSFEVSVLIRQKRFFPKLVYDEYDIGNGMYRYVSKEYLDAERFCIENADGICCRGFEIDYLLHELSFKIKGKLVRFLDYCDGSAEYKRVFDNSKELSLCYIGGITTEREYPGVLYACMLELAQLCEKNRCHLHIYPVCMDETKYKDYIQLDKESVYFHFHQPVSANNICKEISQYDYGIHPIKSGYLEAEDTGYVTKEEMIYAVANKYFTYLDAGLPIIAEGMVKFDKLLQKEHILLEWTIEQYDFVKLKELRYGFLDHVYAARQKFHIDRHIWELIDFYNSL